MNTWEAQAEGCILSLIEARERVKRHYLWGLYEVHLGDFLVRVGGQAFREEWAAYAADAYQALRLLPGHPVLKEVALRAVSVCDPDRREGVAHTTWMAWADLQCALSFATNHGKYRCSQDALSPEPTSPSTPPNC